MRSFIIAALLATVGVGSMIDTADAGLFRRRARRYGNSYATANNGCNQCSPGYGNTNCQPVDNGPMQNGPVQGGPGMNNAPPPAPGPAANAPVPGNPQT